MVTGGIDCSIRVWNLEDLSLAAKIEEGNTEPISCLAINDNKDFIFAGSKRSKTTIKVIHAISGGLVREFEGHKGGITCLAIGLNDSILASGSLDRDVMLWDLS